MLLKSLLPITGMCVGTNILNCPIFIDFSNMECSLKTTCLGFLPCATFKLSVENCPTFLLLGFAKINLHFALGKRLNFYLLSPKTCAEKASL